MTTNETTLTPLQKHLLELFRLFPENEVLAGLKRLLKYLRRQGRKPSTPNGQLDLGDIMFPKP